MHYKILVTFVHDFFIIASALSRNVSLASNYSSNSSNFGINSLNRIFTSPSVITSLLHLLKHGSSLTKCSVLRVCASVFYSTDPMIINAHAIRSGLVHSTDPKHEDHAFLEYLLCDAGRRHNVWHQYYSSTKIDDDTGKFYFRR